MFERVPNSIKLTALAAALLAGPMTVFAFILGGPQGGAIALVAIFFFFIILYMIAVKKYL